MYKIVGASFALLVTCSSAFAADLPTRRAPPVFVPPPPVPAFTWTGFYIGANGGYGFGGSGPGTYTEYDSGGGLGGVGGVGVDGGGPALAAQAAVGTTPVIPTGSVADYTLPLYGSRLKGGFGGGQIGYNYQFSQIVIGVEADGEGSGITANSNVVAPYFDQAVSVGTSNRIGVFGSARGRVGVAFDRFLVYATGGYAYADIHTNQSVSFTDTFNSYASTSGLRSGYAVGGGIEYAFTNNISVKGEYQYYDFGSRTLSAQEYVGGVPTGFYSYDRVRTTFNTARIGLNYRFDTLAPPPVVARY